MPKTKTLAKRGCLKRRSCKKSSFLETVDKFYNYLLPGVYILCSLMIIYSLLVLNGLLAGEAKVKGANFVTVTSQGITYAVEDIWYETVLFMEQTGSQMSSSFNQAIALSHKTAAKIFVLAGNVLAKIPEILTAEPPYAVAREYNRW